MKLGQFIFFNHLDLYETCARHCATRVFSTKKDAFARKIRVASLANQSQTLESRIWIIHRWQRRHRKKISEDGMGGVYSLQALQAASPSKLGFLATESPVSLCYWHTAARAPQNQLLLERGTAHMKTRPPRPRFNCSGRMAKWMMKDLYYVVQPRNGR